MKLNKVFKCLLFTHVFDPTKKGKFKYLFFFKTILQSLTSEKQL